LRGLPISVLSKRIGQLKKLKTLNLGNTKLINLPKEICQLKKLEKLYIYGTSIRTLPKNFHKLSKLKEVRLSRNQRELRQVIEDILPDCTIRIVNARQYETIY